MVTVSCCGGCAMVSVCCCGGCAIWLLFAVVVDVLWLLLAVGVLGWLLLWCCCHGCWLLVVSAVQLILMLNVVTKADIIVVDDEAGVVLMKSLLWFLLYVVSVLWS